MKLSDYIADFLVKKNIKYVFGVTGGAVVHIFDSIDKKPGIESVFTHHEQAASFAAEAYARITNDLGCAIVTTGPGGTNAITGLAAAWLDSVPCIFISGQVRIEHLTGGKPIRQLGSQQLDIVSIVKPITKYAVTINNPEMIRYHLEKAVYLAKNRRPGPVWIDIPLNFQWTQIDPDKLVGFDPKEVEEKYQTDQDADSLIDKCVSLLEYSHRPLILAGYGIRLSGGDEEFLKIIELYGIPVVSSWNASDMIPTDNKSYIGRIGVAGQRGANICVQNCDLLISIGSHLSIQLTGAKYDDFARGAKKIVVDIDNAELENQTVKVDLPICYDAKLFLKKLLQKNNLIKMKDISSWRDKCALCKKYNNVPPKLKGNKQPQYVNPYIFIDTLSDELSPGDVISVDGGGTVFYMSFQALKTKQKQRLIVSGGIGAMGAGLPESIGACFANNFGRTICLCGDGSMQFNIQELQTIAHHNLNIKIFLFNNGGYLAIRHTQDGFLDKRYVGSEKMNGLSLPDFIKVAKSYGIKTLKINNDKRLRSSIRRALKEPGPVLCEIMMPSDQQMNPWIGFDKNSDGTFVSRPLEDMCPYLDRKEFLENMVVKPLYVSEKEIS